MRAAGVRAGPQSRFERCQQNGGRRKRVSERRHKAQSGNPNCQTADILAPALSALTIAAVSRTLQDVRSM
jgi:hypothetical protein